MERLAALLPSAARIWYCWVDDDQTHCAADCCNTMKRTIVLVAAGILGATVVAYSLSSPPAETAPVSPILETHVRPSPRVVPVHERRSAKSEPPDNPSLPADLRESLDAFTALKELGPRSDPGSPEQEDAANLASQRRKATLLQELVPRLQGLTRDSTHQRDAYLLLAEVHTDMGDFLLSAPAPSHLDARGARLFAEGMAGKAHHQYDSALAALEDLVDADPDSAVTVESRKAALLERY